MHQPHAPLGPSSLLQSDEWGAFQATLGKRTHHLQGHGWYGLVVEEKNLLGTIWYLPYGPVLERASALQGALDELCSRAREHAVAWLRLEPQCPPRFGTGFTQAVEQQSLETDAVTAVLESNGGQKAPRDVQPAHTNWVDLSNTPEQILSGMTGTNRNLWRRFQDKGIEIEASTDPKKAERVIDLLHRTADIQGFSAQNTRYLRMAARSLGPSGSCSTYTSTVDGHVVSGLLLYDSPTTRVFAHSGMDPSYRKLRPNQPLIAQALLDAAAQGQVIGDLFGVAPPNRPHHPWAGFSAFKRSFGGADTALGGTWDVPVSALRYGSYRVVRSLRDRAQRVRARVTVRR